VGGDEVLTWSDIDTYAIPLMWSGEDGFANLSPAGSLSVNHDLACIDDVPLLLLLCIAGGLHRAGLLL
jgi:hypothetical protein